MALTTVKATTGLCALFTGTLIAVALNVPLEVVAKNNSKAVKSDPAFTQFWNRFRQSVAKNDRAAVASMTRLPFLLVSEQLNRAQFLSQYSQVFPRGTATCFAKQTPVQDHGSYSAFCGEQIYLFEKTNGKWMFAEIGVND